jgi:rod shape-determining protein MreD
VTPSPAAQVGLRLAAIGFVAALLQITLVSPIGLLGTHADLLPLVVAFAGLLAGSTAGAATGFGIGIVTDLIAVTTLGVSSLLLVPLGYAAGRLRELRDPHHTLVPLAVGAGVTLIYAVGTAIVQLSLGVDAPVSRQVLAQILALTLLGALLSLPVHALMRRILAGAGVDEGRKRRRRAYTTGGLSPLSSSRAGR